MKNSAEKIIIFIFVMMIAVIGYQQWQIHRIEKKLVKNLTSDIEGINNRLEKSDSNYTALGEKLKQAEKKQRIINLQVYNLRKKLKEYEQKTSQADINKLTRDSIRNILTE